MQSVTVGDSNFESPTGTVDGAAMALRVTPQAPDRLLPVLPVALTASDSESDTVSLLAVGMLPLPL